MDDLRVAETAARPVPEALFERVVEFRRELHRHPELGWEEIRTAERVESILDEIGIPHRRLLGTGVVADVPGPAGVPAVAIRADLDGLPIHEETGLGFASEIPGRMHACGHDGHTAIVLGAASLLAKEESLPAPVRIVFQPAEEIGDGAIRMMEAGAIDGVGMIFGGHLDRHYEPGTLIVTEGPVNASTDTFRIRLSGSGGHAARPHEAVDAVVAGSLMVMALQTIVSREINPDRPSVVTVGKFEAGEVSNAIASRATLEGTIRAQDAEVRDHLRRSVKRIAETTATLHGAALEYDLEEGTPMLYNRPGPTALARGAAVRVVGEERVLELDHANMGGEDFSFYLDRVPGCYIRFGARVPGRGGFPNHSSKFDFHEDAMAIAVAWFVEVARTAGRVLAEEARRRTSEPR